MKQFGAERSVLTGPEQLCYLQVVLSPTMRSHLTRNVYRRVLAGRGLVQPCRALSTHVLPIRDTRPIRPHAIIRRPSKRTFFGIFKQPPRELRDPELEPGYLTLLQFTSRENSKVRPPPRSELLRGFRTFFQHKARGTTCRPINSTQALVARPLLRHLLDTSSEGEELTLHDLRTARDVVLQPPKRKTEDHLELSRDLYLEIKKRAEKTCPGGSGDQNAEDFGAYIRALTQYGTSLEASELLASYLNNKETKDSGDKRLSIMVLRGLAAEGQEEELKLQFEKLERIRVRYGPSVHEIMTTFFAKRDNFEETKRWFGKPIHEGKKPTETTYYEILRFAVRTDEKEWVRPIFQQAMETSGKKGTWDVIFQWLVLAMDKGVEDIRQTMISLIENADPAQRGGLIPDASTINGLVEVAIERKDPYLAERFIMLGSDLQIEPNLKTRLLQLDYRLEAKDFSGAYAVYRMLDSYQSEGDEDLAVINKYIRALCAADEPSTERILEITSAVENRNLTLEPETTAAICITLLKTDQQFDVIDTLSLHTIQYSLEERETVRAIMVQYCLDPKISTARVWDAYTLLRQFFPETEPEERVQLMNAFFHRKRPDMACHVFGHMRAHPNTSQRPTADIYVKCLEGIGRCPDEEGLQIVHNMLKMDMTMQMTTKLYNALMLAYVGCDRPDAAFDFWTNITNSVEGPSYNSLAIVFRVCERMQGGDKKARQIWQKLQRMDLEVPPTVYGAYCAAMGSHDNLEEVKILLQRMYASVGQAPDSPM